MSQGWSKIFNRINWLNRPSTNTPLNATNLNAGDSAIDKLDDRIITLDTVKADMQVVNGMVADVSLNESNGVITITYKNGSTKTYDTNLEKIAINFTYDYSTQRLVLTLSDGSKQYVDMSALITQYEFKDSTTIAFSVDSTGKVSASVKNGSITDAMLETGYLANITAQATKAESMANSATTSSNSAYDNAKLSQSYAIGGSGIREGEDTDNAMYYYEQAKKTDIGQIRSEVDELNSNLDVLSYDENEGGKNLLDLPNPYSVTGKYSNSITVKVKKNTYYTLSVGSVTSSVYDGIVVKSINSGTTIISKYGVPYIMPFNSGDNESIRILFYSGNGTSGTSVYSDVQLEEGTEPTSYKPYIPSVKMLADEVSVQNESLGVLGKCKNLLNPILQTTTLNGVTCTNNGDGTYTLNGTVDTGNYAQFNLLSNKNIAGTYKLVGNPDYSLGCSLYFSGHGGTEIDYGNGAIVNFASDITTTNLYLYIPSGVTLTNVVFKPMITENLNATYDDFVPYTGDGETLTADVAELKNDLSEQFHNRSYSGTLSECVSSVAKAIANGQSTTFNFIRENDSYYFGFVGRFTENLIGGLMTNSSGAVYKIGGSVESPTTTQM